jgi:hypothetical protein
VRRALRSAAPPTGKRHRAKGVALEPQKAQITAWLSDEVTSQWTAELGRHFKQHLDHFRVYVVTSTRLPRSEASVVSGHL